MVEMQGDIVYANDAHLYQIIKRIFKDAQSTWFTQRCSSGALIQGPEHHEAFTMKVNHKLGTSRWEELSKFFIKRSAAEFNFLL